MKSKSIILMAVSLGFGLVAAIGISQVMGRNGKSAPQAKTRPVLVATEHIEMHNVLTEANTKIEQWPLKVAPEEAIASLEEIAGMVVKQDVSNRMPIVLNNVVNESEIGKIILPDGYTLFGVKVPAEDGGMLSPGDRVNIIGTVITLEKRIKSKTFLKNIRVISVNSKMIADQERGEGPKGSTVVGVAVTLRQAEKLALYQRAAQIKLVLLGSRPNEALLPADVVDKTEGFDSDDLFGDRKKQTAKKGKLGDFLRGMMGAKKSNASRTTGATHPVTVYTPDGPTTYIFSPDKSGQWGRIPKVIEGYASPSAISTKPAQTSQTSTSTSKSNDQAGSSDNNNSPGYTDSDNGDEED